MKKIAKAMKPKKNNVSQLVEILGVGAVAVDA